MTIYKVEVALNEECACFSEIEDLYNVIKKYGATYVTDTEHGITTLFIKTDKPLKPRELEKLTEEELSERVNSIKAI